MTDGWTRRMTELRTRIVGTALDLFVARGYDHVTVADIAAAAGTSPRTVHRYFPAKEDIVLEPSEFDEFMRALSSAPADLPVLDVIGRVLRDLAPDPSLVPTEAARIGLIVDTPSLQRAWAEQLGRLEADLRQWLAARTGRSATSIEIIVAGAALIAVHRTLVLTWSRSGFDEYLDHAERALALLGDGLAPVLAPAPRART